MARLRTAAEAVQIRYGRIASNGRPFVEVVDKGPGIAAEDIERVFEPFFTKAPRGTGLGLFLARELAESQWRHPAARERRRRRQHVPAGVHGSRAMGRNESNIHADA